LMRREQKPFATGACANQGRGLAIMPA
jgi:hypothetical protein